MNRSANYRGKYPEQSQRQRERARRYENHLNPLTGHITHGLKPGWARGLQPKGA
jgi:hypothetical protein